MEDSLCTLKEAFEKVDLFIGFNIELKFDDEIQYTEDQLRHILQVILEVRNESFHNLLEHSNRGQRVDSKNLKFRRMFTYPRYISSKSFKNKFT